VEKQWLLDSLAMHGDGQQTFVLLGPACDDEQDAAAIPNASVASSEHAITHNFMVQPTHRVCRLAGSGRFVLLLTAVAAAFALLVTRPQFMLASLSAVKGNRIALAGFVLTPSNNDTTSSFSDGDTNDDNKSNNGTTNSTPTLTTTKLAHPKVDYKPVVTTFPPYQPTRVPCPKGEQFAPAYLLNPYVPPFSALPPADQWESIWQKITNNATKDFCATTIQGVVRLPSPHHGFGSSMNNFVNEVLVAMYSQTPMTLCSPPGVRDLWAEHFVDPGLSHCSMCFPPPPEATSAPMVFASGAQASMSLAAVANETLVGIKRFIYKKLFKLSPETDAAVTELQRKLGILDEPYVALHIRRGDKLRESSLFRTSADFASYATKLCDAMGAKKVYVASDDPLAAAEVRQFMPKAIQVVAQPPETPLEYGERGFLDLHTENVLMNDVALLIRANAYVGTASSGLDRWVWFQRDPNTQSISLDDGGDYLRRSC
jgi:hypothetical protein